MLKAKTNALDLYVQVNIHVEIPLLISSSVNTAVKFKVKTLINENTVL